MNKMVEKMAKPFQETLEMQHSIKHIIQGDQQRRVLKVPGVSAAVILPDDTTWLGVSGKSSDSEAIEDRDVAEALHFIRVHAMRPIQVSDVANELCMSRRHLYRKFDKALGRSIHDEIRRTRIEQLKRMLTETDLSVSQIATKMGFSNITHVSRFFRQEAQISPQAFRKQYGRPRDSL